MSTKSLKKQLMAAIAMVLVAAVALGSSTYAWFVTNNTVKATTSQISAQSNAAFMKIKYSTTATTSDLTADYATLASEALYPAQWKNSFDDAGKKSGQEGFDSSKVVYQFETAYGTNPTSTGYVMDESTLKIVGNPEAAVTADYAVSNVFNISSKGTDLTKLKVAGATILTTDTITGETSDAGNVKLDNALRVLVVCGTNWVLCDKSGVILDSEGRTSGDDLGMFGATASSNTQTVTHDADTQVTMYVYYDGNDTEIYSNNLPNLSDSSSRITVTFTAEPQNS